MSQTPYPPNPYATLGAQPGSAAPPVYGGGDFTFDHRPPRISALAIASLVLALICLIPGPGAFAVILGSAAILVINASRGRLRGMGLAVAGTVIGLAVTAIWILILTVVVQGVQYVNTVFLAPAATVFNGIEAGDYQKARSALVPSVAQSITDDQFIGFRDAYHAELGAFTGAPDSLGDYIQGWFGVGPHMQSGYHGPAAAMPIPANFAKGPGLILAEFDNSGQPTAPGSSQSLTNIGIWSPTTGTEIWLLDKGPSQAPAAPNQPGTPPSSSSIPEVPAAAPPPESNPG